MIRSFIARKKTLRTLRVPPGESATSELNILAIGESLTSGSQSTGGVGGEGSSNSYPAVLAGLRGLTYDTDVINMGVGGIGVQTLPDPRAFLKRTRKNVAVLMEGINNFFNAHEDAEDVFDSLTTYIDGLVDDGIFVVVCTLTKVGLSDAPAQASRTAYNTLIREEYQSGHARVRLCDVAADPRIGDSAVVDSTYFAGDSYHLNDDGYAVLAAIINEVIDDTAAANLSPSVDTGVFVPRPRLTGWFRPDWCQRNTSTAQMFTLMNFAAQRTFLRYLAENNQLGGGGHTQVTRVDDVLAGRPAARFPGNQDSGNDKTAYLQSSTLLSSFVSASSFFYAAVIKPTDVQSSNANPHFNDVILGCSGGFGCGLGLRVSGGIDQVFAYADDGAKKVAAVTLPAVGSPVAVFARLHGGSIGVRLGTQGSWVETSCGNIADRTGAFKIGASSLDCLYGDFFDTLTFNAYDAGDDAAVGAYIRARYGSSL